MIVVLILTDVLQMVVVLMHFHVKVMDRDGLIRHFIMECSLLMINVVMLVLPLRVVQAKELKNLYLLLQIQRLQEMVCL